MKIGLIFLLCTSVCFAQSDESSVNLKSYKRLGLTQSIESTDLFTSFLFQKSLPSHFELNCSAGFGLRRTIFDARLYPKASLGILYLYPFFSSFQFGPSIDFSFQTLRLSSTSRFRQSYLGPELGFLMRYGLKHKVFLKVSLGRYYTFYSHSTAGKFSAWFWNYTTQLGYAWTL